MRFDKRPAKKSKTGYTWRVSFDYTDRCGKKRKYSKSGFPTKKAAEAHGHEILNDLQNGLNIGEKNAMMTIDDGDYNSLQDVVAAVVRNGGHVDYTKLAENLYRLAMGDSLITKNWSMEFAIGRLEK